MSDHDEHGPWWHDPLTRYAAIAAILIASVIVGALTGIGMFTALGWLR